MKCGIIKDLLPSYVDSLTSEDSNKEVEKHLEECVECKKFYQQMLPPEALMFESEEAKEQDLQVLKSFNKLHRRLAAMALIIVIVIVGGFFTIGALSFVGSVTIPYDKSQITIRVQDDVNEYIYDREEWHWDGIEVTCQIPNRINSHGTMHIVDTITVDGEEKNVVLLCQTTSIGWRFKLLAGMLEGDTLTPAVYYLGVDGFQQGDSFTASEIDEIYYIDKMSKYQLKLAKARDEGTLQDADTIELIEKHGHLIWTPETQQYE